MDSHFNSNLENVSILFHSLIGEAMAREDLARGGLTRSEIEHRSEVIFECNQVFQAAYDFPGVGIA